MMLNIKCEKCGGNAFALIYSDGERVEGRCEQCGLPFKASVRDLRFWLPDRGEPLPALPSGWPPPVEFPILILRAPFGGTK
jgi:hypothetical protein